MSNEQKQDGQQDTPQESSQGSSTESRLGKLLRGQAGGKIAKLLRGVPINSKVQIGLGLAFLLVIITAVALALSGGEKDTPISPDDPASALLRDDSDPSRTSTPGSSMGDRDQSKPLDPKLFVKLNYNGPVFTRDGERHTSFILTLAIDEKACGAYYGSRDGLAQCRNNWDFLDPDPTGWSTRPESGPAFGTDWKFRENTYSYEARLDMKMDDFPSGVKISVRPPEKLGDNVVIDKKSHDFTSRAYQLDISRWEFLVDPQNPRKLMLSGVVSGSPFVIGRESFEKRLSIDSEGKVELGPTEITYNQSGTEAYVSVPVLSLPQETSPVQLKIKAGATRDKNMGTVKADTAKGANVAGRDVFVSLAGSDNTIITLDDQGEQDKQLMLFLTFTRKLKASEAQASVSALLLPYSRPGEDAKNQRRTDWSEILPEQIRAEDLKEATPLTLTPGAVAEEFSEALPFTYGAPGGRYLLVRGKGGVSSDTGYKLSEYSFISRVPEIDPELRVMQKGSILSMGGARKLAVMSRGVEEIRYDVYRLRPEYLNLLVTQATGSAGLGDLNFESTYYDEKTLEFADISERIRSQYKTRSSDGYQPDYSSIDLSPLLGGGTGSGVGAVARGIFRIELSGFKGDTLKTADNRFILVTDLGMTIKQSATGEREVFIGSFANGGPVSGARVQVLGRNGLPVFSRQTDAQGRVSLPELSGFTQEKKPVAVTVEKNGDFTFMSIEDYSRQVSLAAFPQVAGRRVDKDGVSVFAFSERGIYRPGENLRFGLIAKPGNWQAEAMAGLPLKAVLLDPRGNKIYERSFKLDRAGMFDLDIGMDETYPTGNYNLDIYLSQNLIGSTQVQVEEFQPDNLKLRVSFKDAPSDTEPGQGLSPGAQKGWTLPKALVGLAQVENLYGTAAVGNRVGAYLSLTPARLSFSKFAKYAFYDPSDWDNSYNQRLGDQETDEQGEAEFALAAGQLASGTAWLTFEAEAFEAGGGRSVSGSARLLISPLETLVGWSSEADLGFLASNSKASVNFIAIDPNLEYAGLPGLTLKISEVTYVASLVRDSAGRYRYDNTRKLIPVLERPVGIGAVGGGGATSSRDAATMSGLSEPDTADFVAQVDARIAAQTASGAAAGLSVDLPTDKTGEFTLTLTDATGVERCKLDYVVAGGSQRRFGLERDATLRIHLDKQEYNAGEEMKIFISAPYAGAGLITVESDKVYASKWFRADTSDSVQTLTVPGDFEGRAFVSVALTRDINSDAIHSTPYTYAVTPFVANIARRNMNLKLEAPERVQPGESLNMKVSAEKPGKVVVYAVSEGILQLTNYKTPSPLDYFLRQNPLTVSTMQNLDLIMPEFYLMNRSAFGGGMMMDMASAASEDRLNPFRRKAEPSVVYWSGVLDVDTQGRDLAWEVPAYFNGTLRLMAVAASPEAVGEFALSTQVRGPLIITPDLPVAVAPGDEFEVTAAVANNVEGSGAGLKIDLKVELDEGLSFVREPETSLTVDEGREGKAVFRLKVNDRLGESVVRFTASVNATASGVTPADVGGTEIVVRRPVSLSVRPASPRMSSFRAGFVKGDEQVVPLGRAMYSELAEVEASVSGLPLPLVDGLSGFLIRYPHGCTEQILSKAFPYALLHESPELLPVPKGETPALAREKAVAAINRGILTLRERQVQPGRFSLWPQESYSYSFLTVYGFDFLLSAREAGFDVPEDLFENTRREVAALLQTLPNRQDAARLVCYAAWVYTRSGQRFTGLPELVRHLDANLRGWRKDTCAAFLAASYQMLRQSKEAEELIKEVRMIPYAPDVTIQPANADKDAWTYNSWFFSRLWDNGAQLNIIARYFPEQLDTVRGRNLLVGVVNEVFNGGYTTISSAQAIRGIIGYALGNIGNKQELALYPRDAQHEALPVQATGEAVKRLVTDTRAAEFFFGGAAGLYWQITTDGFDKEPPKARASKVNIQAEYKPAGGKALADLAQGDEVYVLLTASAVEPIDNIAITSLIPGGFEMVISKGGRIVGGGAGDGGDYEEEIALDAEDGEAWDIGATRAYPNETRRGEIYNILGEAGLNGTPMDLVHVERREDRMIVYTSLNTQSRVFIYRIKAINKGSYTLPTVFVEALYDPDARANTNPGRIEVK
ncbi:MAG: hypothetical protein LBV80_02305 [Deltaproteobacteria bacterium]|jgi:uncharacterized protein YfaS (alpha-2-macroglobulin family)|nr:hypothetical protein [Deltaproteobacteria bacterium]